MRKHIKKRKDITNDVIEYALANSEELKDREWEDALNAISRVQPSGRMLKVLYKKLKGKVFITSRFVL